MSGRFATTRHTTRRTTLLLAVAVLSGLACGLLVTARPAVADSGDPLPADTPRRKPHEKFAINSNYKMFEAIQDFKPVAREDVNPDEFRAWLAVLLHARKFETADLESHAARDLVPLDLVKGIRAAFRLELIRFDGQLSAVRRLDAPEYLKAAGISELYEIRLVPRGESPLTPVSVVFTQLPDTLAAVKQKKPAEWLDASGWVTAAGYYFKTMNVPGAEGNSVIAVPVLIGKSVTLRAGPPAPPDGNPTALDKNVRVYTFIRDDVPMIRTSPTEATWPEVAAYNRVILHASRFSPQELEQHARTDLKFADLFENIRIDYKLDLVKFEGRLISLRRVEVNDWLKAAGVSHLFEGWLIPRGQPQGHPVCIVFTEPLEGVEPDGRVNKWVTFAGYSFKRMEYESGEADPNNPKRNLHKLAPLLIGRAPIVRSDPDVAHASLWDNVNSKLLIIGFGVILAVGCFVWWFMRDRQHAKRETESVRQRNPFGAAGDPPA